MSITLKDCLKLPSLRDAEVIAGHAGLEQPITTVTVLEYAHISAMEEQLFLGGELVLTALISVKDSVEQQRAAIRHLSEMGEIGMLLYYVGYYVQQVDQTLIDTANELQFPLILMAPNTYSHRYSDVITEVLEAIFIDRQRETNIVSGMLERITRLPDRKKTVDHVLRLLSDRFHSSFLLLSREGREMGFAGWPLGENQELTDHFRWAVEENREIPEAILWQDKPIPLRHRVFDTVTRSGCHLYVMDEGGGLNDVSLGQSVEVLQMFYRVWKDQLLQDGADTLVRAVLNDQLSAASRIAVRWGIDPKRLRVIWMIRVREGQPQLGQERLHAYVRLLKEQLKDHGRAAVADTFDDWVVAFSDNGGVEEDRALAQTLLELLAAQPEPMVLAWEGGMSSIQDIRRFYTLVEGGFAAVCSIYLKRRMFTLRELSFAQACVSLITKEPQELFPVYDRILAPILGQKDEADLLETLAVYLIDTDGNISETAHLLHVHVSTVKYRIGKIQQRLGYNLAQMPAQYFLYQAAAIHRLKLHSL